MITRDGYSKDPSIMPDGIVVTFGKEMIAEKGGLLLFIRWFEVIMCDEGGMWMHKSKNRPKYDENLLYVYVIICNRVYYRCYYGGYHQGGEGYFTPNSELQSVPWPYIILAGPFEKAPRKIIRRGFQGFRYATKLF